jgi:hypothetical protein
MPPQGRFDGKKWTEMAGPETPQVANNFYVRIILRDFPACFSNRKTRRSR